MAAKLAVKDFLVRSAGLAILLPFIALVSIMSLIRPRPALKNRKPTVLITGQFASPNWLAAHLLPISQSEQFATIWLVSTDPELECAGVTWVKPSKKAISFFGGTGARLFSFGLLAFRHRPDWIAGFHLLFNGLIAILLAKLTRARSFYFCVGGPAEIAGGGIDSENRLFARQSKPSKTIEVLLTKASHYADAIVFMGSRAKAYYVNQGYSNLTIVNPGGVCVENIRERNFSEMSIDVLFVGRLSRIKDLPLLLEAIALARGEMREIRAAIVGDGEEREYLQNFADKLGLGENLIFAGYQANVGSWLKKSKMLILTSKTEGLSLAVMEAMSYGLPVIAPDVGDLGDAIESENNGYLIGSRNPKHYADAVVSISKSKALFNSMSQAARKKGRQFSQEAAANRWRQLLSNSGSGDRE